LTTTYSMQLQNSTCGRVQSLTWQLSGRLLHFAFQPVELSELQ